MYCKHCIQYSISILNILALLWTSPENINFPYPRMTKEGDIYGFGIIMSEIINRGTPFDSYSQYTARGMNLNFV